MIFWIHFISGHKYIWAICMKYDTLCDNADKTCLWHKKSFQLHFRMRRTYKSKSLLFLYGNLLNTLRIFRESVILILLNIGNHSHHKNMFQCFEAPFHRKHSVNHVLFPWKLLRSFVVHQIDHRIWKQLSHSSLFIRLFSRAISQPETSVRNWRYQKVVFIIGRRGYAMKLPGQTASSCRWALTTMPERSFW